MADDTYSIKDVIEEFRTDTKESLNRIEAQVLKTNGRVTKLETDRTKIWTAITVVVFLFSSIGFLVKFWVEQSIRTIAKESVVQALDEKASQIIYEESKNNR